MHAAALEVVAASPDEVEQLVLLFEASIGIGNPHQEVFDGNAVRIAQKETTVREARE